MDAAIAPRAMGGRIPRTEAVRRRRIVVSLGVTALIGVLFAGAANAAGMSMNRAELEQFAQRLNLTSAQRSQVNTVTQALVRESDAILQKYGVSRGVCTDLGPIQLSALNGEVNGAYSRARVKLSSVLSANQLREFGAIYQEKRRAAQGSIVCRQSRS